MRNGNIEDRTDKTIKCRLTWVSWERKGMLVEGFLLGVVGKDLPRKTVSLVVALVSPTLLEATHSYMASSRGVRNG